MQRAIRLKLGYESFSLGLSPSGVSSLSISNHSGLKSIRDFFGSRSAIFVVNAMTASPSATFGWHLGKFSGARLRMHQAQCSISSVYPRLGGPLSNASFPTAADLLPLSVVSSVGPPSFALTTPTAVFVSASL